MFSERILDVKDKKESGISYFYKQLDEEICKNITICVVPSHMEGNTNGSGIAKLARRLAQNGRIDKIDYLLKNETVDKLAHGGSRDIIVKNGGCLISEYPNETKPQKYTFVQRDKIQAMLSDKVFVVAAEKESGCKWYDAYC